MESTKLEVCGSILFLGSKNNYKAYFGHLIVSTSVTCFNFET